MIHILLTTLKVIGILLAITLGLILALILVVLFVPIRYKADINNLDVRAKVTWLLHFVSVSILFVDKKLEYKIRILGIPINLDKKSKKPVKEEKTKAVEKKTIVSKESVAEKEAVVERETIAERKPVAEKETIAKKKSLFEIIKEKIKIVKDKVKQIYDKIISIKDKISIYKKFLTTKAAKENLKIIFGMLFDLLLYILPTKLRGCIKFGFDSPETTGKTLGIASMFYGIYGDKIDLEPDFDKKVFEADIKFKGRIRLYRILVVGFKIWKNQWIKKLIKFVKTH